MTHRDQVAGALGGLDARDPSGGDHFALGEVARDDRLERLRAHPYGSAGAGFAAADRLGGDVDHPGLATRSDVGQLFGFHRSASRSSRRTSFWCGRGAAPRAMT